MAQASGNRLRSRSCQPPGAVEERKYKRIYFHKVSKTWQVVRQGNYAPVSGSPDQDTAASNAAKAWGVSRRSLLLRTTPALKPRERPVNKFRRITWHSRAQQWVLQHGGKTLANSKDLEEVVSKAIKYFRTTREALELGQGKRAGSGPNDTCKRFATLWKRCTEVTARAAR